MLQLATRYSVHKQALRAEIQAFYKTHLYM